MKLLRYSIFETFEPRKVADRHLRKQELDINAYVAMCQQAIKFQTVISSLKIKKDGDIMGQFFKTLIKKLEVFVPEFGTNLNGEFFLVKPGPKPSLYAVVRDGNVVLYNYYEVIDPIVKRYLCDSHVAKKIAMNNFEKLFIPDLRREAFSVMLSDQCKAYMEYEILWDPKKALEYIKQKYKV